MKIYQNTYLRRFLLPILKFLSFDFHYVNPWTKDKIKLNLFKHKGYWYHGAKRESHTMKLFGSIIGANDIVISVGGHIGFISQYYAFLTSPDGKVFVFEPGLNNLPYIRDNIKNYKNIFLEEKAVGKRDGFINFYEEGLTGQNNSIVKGFNGLEANNTLAYVNYEYIEREVELVSLDSYLSKFGRVDFVKIDIEGGEWDTLQGFSNLISFLKPIIMVEIQTNREDILNFFNKNDYLLFNPQMAPIVNAEELISNIFCFHSEKHRSIITELLNNNR